MNKEKKNLLVFGYGLAVIGLFIAWRVYAHHGWGWGSYVAIGAAVTALFLTLFNQAMLKTVYTYWMKGAHFISMIITTIILTLLFYIVFGIAGIALRILRKDILNLKSQPDVKTYWKQRQKVYNKEDYLRQF